MILELQEWYARFVIAFIQDSTIIRPNKKLADRFLATQSKTVAPGVKITYLPNVLANGPGTISIVSIEESRGQDLPDWGLGRGLSPSGGSRVLSLVICPERHRGHTKRD